MYGKFNSAGTMRGSNMIYNKMIGAVCTGNSQKLISLNSPGEANSTAV